MQLLHQRECPNLTDAARKKYLEDPARQKIMNDYASVLGRISDDDTTGYRKMYKKNITMTDMWMIFDPLYIEVCHVLYAQANETKRQMNWNHTYYNKKYNVTVPAWANKYFKANNKNMTLYQWITFLNNQAIQWYFAPKEVIKIEGG